MDSLWAILGALVAGAGLVWSIFAFVVDKRDKVHNEEKSQFYKDLYDFEDRVEKTLNALGSDVVEIRRSLDAMRLTLEVQKEKFSNMTERFHEYVVRVDKIIDRHQKELDRLGKIINVGE